jgi:hypothetical protein
VQVLRIVSSDGPATSRRICLLALRLPTRRILIDLPSGAIDTLMDLYLQDFPRLGGYLTESGEASQNTALRGASFARLYAFSSPSVT